MTFKNWPSYRYFNLVYPLPKNSPPPLPPQHWPKCLKYFVVLHNKIRRQSAWQKTCAIFWACLHCPSGIGFWPTPPTTTTSSQQQQKLKRSSPHGSAALLTSPDFSLFSQAVSVHFSLYGVGLVRAGNFSSWAELSQKSLELSWVEPNFAKKCFELSWARPWSSWVESSQEV